MSAAPSAFTQWLDAKTGKAPACTYGNGRPCAAPTLPGCRQPICAYHWARGNWGPDWAARCHPEHPEAQS